MKPHFADVETQGGVDLPQLALWVEEGAGCLSPPKSSSLTTSPQRYYVTPTYCTPTCSEWCLLILSENSGGQPEPLVPVPSVSEAKWPLHWGHHPAAIQGRPPPAPERQVS